MAFFNISFSDDREHRLRPKFFAFEDRYQITDLFVESYTKYAIAVGKFTKGVVPSAKLWEKTDAVMTDGATKT